MDVHTLASEYDEHIEWGQNTEYCVSLGLKECLLLGVKWRATDSSKLCRKTDNLSLTNKGIRFIAYRYLKESVATQFSVEGLSLKINSTHSGG